MANRILLQVCVAVALVACTLSADAQRSAPGMATVMTVQEMCGGCVKKITERFNGVEAIANLRCDVETKSVTVVPAQGYVLSPRGLWDAMTEIGKTPTKLVGPSGTFATRPPQ